MNDTSQQDKSVPDMYEHEYDAGLLMSVCSIAESDASALPKDPGQEIVGEIPNQGGGVTKVRYELQHVRQVYLDEYAREHVYHMIV